MSLSAHQLVGTFTPVAPDRLELGEGPRLPADGDVVLVDIPTGRLLRLPKARPGAPLKELARLAQPLGAGALHRWDPDGSVTCVLDGLTVPNGPAFGPDGRTLSSAPTAAAR
ncbi:SMP-30/gluconolactonase/LRE family protein [Streptomyces sp. NPDC053750]|uniref:SMP-30/gluconolactonase/LRE family protein n=1 Tax=Streptomyces sp. NPDC053750 TaxID=3365714 RepID=UPI0037D0628F